MGRCLFHTRHLRIEISHVRVRRSVLPIGLHASLRDEALPSSFLLAILGEALCDQAVTRAAPEAKQPDVHSPTHLPIHTSTYTHTQPIHPPTPTHHPILFPQIIPAPHPLPSPQLRTAFLCSVSGGGGRGGGWTRWVGGILLGDTFLTVGRL